MCFTVLTATSLLHPVWSVQGLQLAITITVYLHVPYNYYRVTESLFRLQIKKIPTNAGSQKVGLITSAAYRLRACMMQHVHVH